MSFPTSLKGNVSAQGKRRLVAKTRWELPFGDAKPYWDVICKDIESKVSMTVRNPLFSDRNSCPITAWSSSIPPSIASSVDGNGSSIYKKNRIICQTTPKAIGITSPAANSTADSQLSTGNTTLERGSVECKDDWLHEISSGSSALTKLSKMTRLVNNFLSNIRPHVAECSSGKPGKKLSRTKRKENNQKFQAASTTERSSIESLKDEASRIGSLAREATPTEESTAETLISGHPISTKKTVVFRDALEGRIRKDSQPEIENIPEQKPRRARAPSLSIASAVPSFGKVVISIEDIDSTETEEKHENMSDSIKENASKDSRRENEPDEFNDRDEKTMQHFLTVPSVRSAGSASYPIYEESKYQQPKHSDEKRSTHKAPEAKFLRESEAFKEKYKLWPKRSIVNVFRAVKSMSKGLRRKARIESETNQFFAEPLEVYSPSGKSSISSDDQMDFVESTLPASTSDPDDDEITLKREYDANDWIEEINEESNASSYTSVRKRLMRNAVAHLSRNSQNDAADTCIDIRTAPEMTFEQVNPSSFYISWATSKNEVMERRRRKKPLGENFNGIPKVNRMLSRVKADKCLACMCRSLGDVHQPRLQKKPSTFWNFPINDYLEVADNELPAEIQNANLSTAVLLDQLDRDRYQSFFMAERAKATLKMDDHPVEASSGPEAATDQVSPRDSEISKAQQSVIDAVNTTDPQAKDLHPSRALSKSPTKILVTAKTLISSLISDRTRSISDQDDSDQGYIESAENQAGVGGGPTMKNLAPCHMPINLKPSLEPLRALKNKKSRSIRSRVASAEKSGGSINDDDNDSDYDIGGQRLNEISNKLESLSGPRGDGSQKVNAEVYGTPPDKPKQTVDDSGKVALNDVDAEKSVTSDSPILSDYEIIEISKKCLANDMTTVEILQILANEYSNRLTSRHSVKNGLPESSNARNTEKKALNLMTLLAESKSYLNRGKRPINSPDPLISSKQPSLCNARQLRRILPLKSYNLVAPILGMAKLYPKRKMTTLREVAKKVSRTELSETSRDDDFDLIVHPPSRLERNVSFERNRAEDHPKLNPYSLFLVKSRRKTVTWRPLTERDLEGYDPEATLKKRAAKITDEICQNFCQWLENLAAGTNRTSGIDVEVLKDMFETDFTAEVCKTMQVCIKEMPMVPTAVALARNCPDATELALTRKHLAEDAKAEMRSTEMAGFGSVLPSHRRFKPPRNQVDRKWLQCENVPKELETMDAVWKGITHLESVKGFAKWLTAHPEVKRPKGLEKLLSSKRTVKPKKSLVTDFKDQELELDQIQSLRVAEDVEHTY